MSVLDGVRQGHALGALLGYRFERGLRERSVTLAKWILPLRRLAPMPLVTGGDSTIQLEAIAARDVVDSVKLLELWKSLGDGLFTNRPELPSSGPDKDGIVGELVEVDALVGAISDLLLAESVHQMAMGNTERAAAAMDALDRQGPAPEPEVTRTPRTGTMLQHRVLVALQATAPPAAWSGAPVDPRAAADPRLNAWAGGLLGDPARFRFAVEVLGEDTDSEGNRVVLETLECLLSDLGLSPLATVWAATSGAARRASELEERIVFHLSGQIAEPDAVAELRLLDGKRPGWPASAIGLRELLATAAGIQRLLGGHRVAARSDLALATDLVDASFDEAELAARTDAAVTALRAARTGLDGVLATTNPAEAAIAGALLAAADLGVIGAIPADLGNLDQVQRVRTEVFRRLDAAESAADALNAKRRHKQIARKKDPDAISGRNPTSGCRRDLRCRKDIAEHPASCRCMDQARASRAP